MKDKSFVKFISAIFLLQFRGICQNFASAPNAKFREIERNPKVLSPIFVFREIQELYFRGHTTQAPPDIALQQIFGRITKIVWG